MQSNGCKIRSSTSYLHTLGHVICWQVQMTPSPKNRDLDSLSTGTPVEKPKEIVVPFAKLQLAAWKRAEQASKNAPCAPWPSFCRIILH